MNKSVVVPILQRLEDLGPLDPDTRHPEVQARYERYYIEGLHGHRNDTIAQLALDIEVSSGGRRAHLFTGTIGSGKSTELNRLCQSLRAGGHYATLVNAREYLNPQLAVSVSELLLAMALAVWEATAAVLKVNPEAGARWQWWTSLFNSGVEARDVELTAGVAKFKLALQSNPSIRERIRQFHTRSLDKLVGEVHQFFDECALRIREQLGLRSELKLVLVMDSLEHFGGAATPGQPDVVFNSLLDTFNTHARHFQLPGWTVVYSVPPLLPKLSPGISSAWNMSKTYALTSAHVFQDRSSRLDEDTVQHKLVPLVRKRVGEAEVDRLIAHAQIRRIIEMTGGDLRDLLRCTRAVLLKGLLDDSFPVSNGQLVETFADLRRPYLPLSQAVRARLREVAARHDVRNLLSDDHEWPLVMADLAQKRVLMYSNSQEWYGVHPLLRDAIDDPEVPADAGAQPAVPGR